MRRQTSADDRRRPENPQKGANWLSILFFWYTVKVFQKGFKRDLDEGDLTKPLDEHRSGMLGNKIAIIWSKEVEYSKEMGTHPSLTKVLFKCFSRDIILYGAILLAMEIPIRLHQPFCLGLMLRYFTEQNKNNPKRNTFPMYWNRIYYFWKPNQSRIEEEEAWLYATGVILCSLVNIMVIHPIMMAIQHVGMKMRVACCSLIYRKSLRISLVAMSGATAGNIVNLMSNDVNRFDMVLLFLHYLWIGPTQMAFGLMFLYREVGLSAVIGMTSVIAFIPLQAWFGNRTSIFRLQTALRTDERVRQMNEIIQGMQVIKMYTWEFAFAELIHKLRRSEIQVLRLTSYIRGVVVSLIMFITRFGIFLTVLGYVLLDYDKVTAEKVFIVTSYYQILRQTMTVYFAQGIAQIAECSVAISRIKELLLTEESFVGDQRPINPKLNVQTYSDKVTNLLGKNALLKLSDGVSAKFAQEICLQKINFEVKQGVLTVLIGQVGCGKTCVLNLVLGELIPYEGKVQVYGIISYASQEAWLFAGSVKQNILFGREFNRQRYQQVVKVCALQRDFQLLPYGDNTIVGERGISLSGGQRARVNLARAVYKEADIYLLDDPLSAVDTHVGKHLFDQCITGYLRDKIVILVTHQLQYLEHVDQIIIMGDGQIQAKGTFESLKVSGISFATFLAQAQQQPKDKQSPQAETKLEEILTKLTRSSKASLTVVEKEEKGLLDIPPEEELEMRSVGSVGCDIYKGYFLAGGQCCVVLCMLSMFFWAQGFASSGDYFLCQWVNAEEIRAHNNTTHGFVLTRKQSILIYSIIMIVTIIVVLSRSFFFFTVCMRASINLHDRMFNSIITASMHFFNTNTSGRILNRFSKDIGAIDELLPVAFMDCTQIILNLVGAAVVIAVINYYLLLPIAIICTMFYLLRKYYITTSRSVKRLEGITRSPVFGHLNATLQGLSTIRSNGAEMILTKEFDEYQDIHSSAWFLFIATSRAFGLWLDILCTIFLALVTYSFMVFKKQAIGSEAGLAITQCIGLSGLFQWGMKQSAELENQMTAVERVLEFLNVEHEPSLYSEPSKKPPKTWPEKGRVEFKNLVMKYKPENPPVLKNLNFVILPKEKIGIVGRTGAGKSSLIAALFRLAPFEGHVVIDAIDTTQIGLHDLRRKVSIIPQEPVLFSGTLRYNLDPFNEYNDKAMLDALIIVEIKAALNDGIDCLDLHMSEGGTNISVGERQMVCLARAVLRNNVILVLDEATANVDPQTDKFIQSTIRTKFAQCTVLTIAHRLNTIMDSDKVLVMDAGIAVEFDHPHKLLKNANGYFTKMVDKTGPGMAGNLKKIAQQNFEKKNKPKT